MPSNQPIPGRIFTKLEELSKRSPAQPGPEFDQAHSLMPNWSDAVRRVPNVALRSALFGAISRGRRPYVEGAEIHAQSGYSVLYTGALLDQGDLDVWETVMHMARTQALGAECRVTAYRLLKVLGRTDTGKNRQILNKHLSRLKATALQLRCGGHSYEGSLLQEIYREHGADGTRSFVIRLNPQLHTLFVGDQFTEVDWSVRQALNGKPLAQWLHGFYASHANPFPLKVDTLHRLCGSRACSLSDFKKDLRRALDSLAEASSTMGQPFSYVIEGALVRVKSTPSPSQRRHLDRKS